VVPLGVQHRHQPGLREPVDRPVEARPPLDVDDQILPPVLDQSLDPARMQGLVLDL
jgi:hypothetical protein